MTGLTGLGLLTGSAKGSAISGSRSEEIKKSHFNMSGYVAGKLNTVRLGFIGLGNRGPVHLEHNSKLDGVEIKAICDLRPERLANAKKRISGSRHHPDSYTGNDTDWKKVCERNDIDLIYIATPWQLHTPMAVYAMNQGKHVAIEVPAATTLEECWQLVEASEKNKRHCVMLENCCYDFFELLTLNMTQQGFFGEIVHAEGAYIHDLMHLNFSKTKYPEMWRLKQNFKNGNLYATHGLGPVCQAMNINRGDQMEYLVSMSSNDFSMKHRAEELAATDDFFKPFAGKTYRGNMNTSVVRTHKGKTIMIQHDVSSPRVYSRIHLLSGTKGAALKYPSPKISLGHEGWMTEENFKLLEEKYKPNSVKKIGELAKQIGGHGGMDFMMNWRLIDCLRNGIPLDMDVYDAALWSSVTPLSQQSIQNRSGSVDVPDFTSGHWKKNKPVDLSLSQGGDTKVNLE